MTPFTMDVTDNAHQIPSSPRDVALRRIANGILALVNKILITLQR